MTKLLAFATLAATTAFGTAALADNHETSDLPAQPQCYVASGQGVGQYVATLPLHVSAGEAKGTIHITHPSVHGDAPIVLSVSGTEQLEVFGAEVTTYVNVSGGTPLPGSVVTADLHFTTEGNEGGAITDSDADVILNGHHIIENGTVTRCGE